MKSFAGSLKNLLILSFLALGFFTVMASETQAWTAQHTLSCSGPGCTVGERVYFNYTGPNSVAPGAQINVSFYLISDDYPASTCPLVRYYEQGGAFPITTDMEPNCYTNAEFTTGIYNNHSVTAPSTPGNYNICITSGLGGSYVVPPPACRPFTVTAPPSGTINVGANIPGASWTITGPETISGSGNSASYTNRSTGSYTIGWGNVSGYTKPANSSQTLGSGGTINFSGNYNANPVPSVQLYFQ
jgi:hypothetical protein